MAFDISSTLDNVLSFVKTKVENAHIGDFTMPAQGRVAAAVMMGGVTVVTLFADGGTRERHTILIRILTLGLQQPEDSMERTLARVVSELTAALFGDMDLGATVQNIDMAGTLGVPVSTEWGYLTINNVSYRVADITLPLIVNDSATAAQ